MPENPTTTFVPIRRALGAFVVFLIVFSAGYWAGSRGTVFDRGYNTAIAAIADCSLEDARADRCFIPCSTDADCLAKNGQTDH